jgi:uncharacterized membrane protein YcaP (DUF421 family)
VIVENGKVNSAVLRQNHVSAQDLEEDLRLNANTNDITRIRIARIERSGDISFIKGDN